MLLDDYFYHSANSLNSLVNRFTKTGGYHDQAAAHLDQLRLKKLAEESGANELGRRVRSLLIQPFKDARLVQ